MSTDDAERVRRQRKIMKKALGPRAIPSYESSMETTTRQLLPDLKSRKLTTEDALLKYARFSCQTSFPAIRPRYTSSVPFLILCTDTMRVL